MGAVVAYLVRCVVILVGYVIASLAASAFIHVIFFAAAGFTADEMSALATGSFFFSIPFVALFVAYFGFLPTVIAIVVAEFLGRRDWLFYALAGAFVAAVFLGFADQTFEAEFEAAGLISMAAVLGSGMVGGIFYWLSAGRWAGSWRGRQAHAPATSPEPSGS